MFLLGISLKYFVTASSICDRGKLLSTARVICTVHRLERERERERQTDRGMETVRETERKREIDTEIEREERD